VNELCTSKTIKHRYGLPVLIFSAVSFFNTSRIRSFLWKRAYTPSYRSQSIHISTQKKPFYAYKKTAEISISDHICISAKKQQTLQSDKEWLKKKVQPFAIPEQQRDMFNTPSAAFIIQINSTVPRNSSGSFSLAENQYAILQRKPLQNELMESRIEKNFTICGLCNRWH
jgi:hypothetical protein